MTDTQTVHVQRILRAPPERVYRAFLNPAAFAKWLPPRGFTGEVEAMDAQVGGRYRMVFTNFCSGTRMGFGGEYLALAENTLLHYTNVFDDPGMPGSIQTQIVLRPVLCGTELLGTQSGLPPFIPAEMCLMGWQESLTQLALLVEADVPG
jgi:uncharacterized protein YndB with AHSA1/START domain